MWAGVGFDTCVNSLMCLHFSWFTATRNSIIFHASILHCTTISKLLAYVKIRKTEKFFRCHAYGCLSLHFLGFGSIIFGLLDLRYSGFHEKFVPPWAESSFTADVSCATEMGYSLEQVRNKGVEDKKCDHFRFGCDHFRRMEGALHVTTFAANFGAGRLKRGIRSAIVQGRKQ